MNKRIINDIKKNNMEADKNLFKKWEIFRR